MKKMIFSALVCALMIPAFTSCKDMLEEVNYGNPTTEELTKNADNVVLMVGQAYADVKWLHDHWGYWGVNMLTSDEGVCPVRMPEGHWSDGGYWKNLNTHQWTKFAKAFENIWNTTISGAVLCNKLIYQLQDSREVVGDSVYAQYISELECLRSYYYYMLFDCFGRIPYQEDFGKYKDPLMEPARVWAKLVTCLERDAVKLPAVGSEVSRDAYYGRCSKAFAYALLARLYLNAPSYQSFNQSGTFIEQLLADTVAVNALKSVKITIANEQDFYTQAARCCEQIISGKAGSYSIESNWFANFKMANQDSQENIFVIVEDGRANFDYRDYAGSMSNKLRVTMLTLHYCHQTTWNLIEKPWNGFCARPSFINLYRNNSSTVDFDFNADVRGPGLPADIAMGTHNTKDRGWFLGPVFGSGSDTLKDAHGLTAVLRPEIYSLDSATWNDGARLFKYEIDKSSTYKFCENDFVLFRLADVYWMNEEAIKRGGTGGVTHIGDAEFQMMLGRAFGNATLDGAEAFKAAYGDPSSWSLEQVCDERGREFAWENMRRRDLIRFGKYEDVEYVTGMGKAASRRWFPIPYRVLEKALRDDNGQSIWTQNEGY